MNIIEQIAKCTRQQIVGIHACPQIAHIGFAGVMYDRTVDLQDFVRFDNEWPTLETLTQNGY
jgi:hypothetical protein